MWNSPFCLFCMRKVAVSHTVCAKVNWSAHARLLRTPCVKQLLCARKISTKRRVSHTPFKNNYFFFQSNYYGRKRNFYSIGEVDNFSESLGMLTVNKFCLMELAGVSKVDYSTCFQHQLFSVYQKLINDNYTDLDIDSPYEK